MWIDRLVVLHPAYNEATDDYEDGKTFLPRLFEWLDLFCPGWAIHNSPDRYYHWQGSCEAQQAYYRQRMLDTGMDGGHFRLASEDHLVLCVLSWPDSQVIPWYQGSL